MASNEETREIDKFITPIRCLYNEYATTIDKFKEEHGVLLVNYELEDLGDDAEYKLYAEFSKDNDGELARELVQTWICDNRLEVTNCIRIALDNRNQSFSNWFLDSEQYSSPDELLLYCLGKQNNRHISIFNSKYVWSTLLKHIRYDYFEIVDHSHIILVFLGERHYAIFRKKSAEVEEPSVVKNTPPRSKGRGRAHTGNSRKITKTKTVCRSSNRKSQNVSSTSKHSQTLASSRKERFGVSNNPPLKDDAEKYGRGKRCRGQTVDYRKLNEGDEQIELPPASPKRIKHIPTRSGPTPHHQNAQKQVTENPRVTTLSTVKRKKETAVKDTQSVMNQPLIGVPVAKVSSNTATNATDSITTTLSSSTSASASTTVTGTKDAFLGVPETDDLFLPDLVFSKDATTGNTVSQGRNVTAAPIQDVVSMDDEQHAVDALLSLSNMCDIPPSSSIDTELDIDDNALLVPIGGQAICDDAAPTESRLGQIEVDNEIARIIATEEYTELEKSISNHQTTPLVGVPDQRSTIESAKDTTTGKPKQIPEPSPTLFGVRTNLLDQITTGDHTPTQADSKSQEEPPAVLPDDHQGVRPKPDSKKQTTIPAGKKGSKGAFKSQLYGLRRKHPKDRAYKCQVCGISKRSMESLNDHHRRNHNPQMCGVCGKMFDLATTLAHHMYSHNEWKYYCDKCDYHCFFKSELESHKIVHREGPSFQCMYPKCGRWFKRKVELSLHVETHKKTWYDCKKCDFSTKLLKYLKEHKKSHLKKNEELPYACDICGERFMWHSGVKRHKEKEHSS